MDQEPAYVAKSPSGETVKISPELFRALQKFLRPTALRGTITIHCKNGGIAGVEGTEVYK